MKHLLYLPFVLALIGCSGNNDNEISSSGTIETTEVTVSAKVGGQVLKLLVDEGWVIPENLSKKTARVVMPGNPAEGQKTAV